MRNVKLFVAVAALAGLAGSGASAQAPAAKKPVAKAPAKHVMVLPGDLTWGPGPPSLPAGVEVAVLDGDPGKAAMFTMRAKMPDGYVVPPHSHPSDEHVTVVSGTMMMGMGSKTDEPSMHALAAGGYAKFPARSNHYVRFKGETILQISAMGPFDVKYVNPNDDPRKKATSHD